MQFTVSCSSHRSPYFLWYTTVTESATAVLVPPLHLGDARLELFSEQRAKKREADRADTAEKRAKKLEEERTGI